MANYTENYNLKKPDRTDFYSVQDFNDNADIIDAALNDKLNKDFSNASGGVIPITSGGTGNSAGYIRTGQKENTSVGSYATCEGRNTTASGNDSHAEGGSTTASSDCAHAEGYYTTASGLHSHAEGEETKASAACAHAEGFYTTASGNCTHAEGYYTTASGLYSHAEGNETEVTGNYSHVEGYKTYATGACAHAEGHYAFANGDYSHAEGCQTRAQGAYSHASGLSTSTNMYQTVVGRYNVENGSRSSYTAGSGYFIVGSGTDSSAKANCFRATESNTYGKTYNTSGADYAEMFEWLDENQLNEDRAGKFVTLDGNKIRLANEKDTYILGVVSGNASVIGDSYADQWAYMYEQDVFGRPIYKTVTIPEERDENGDLIVEEHTEEQLKVSSKYDNTKKYIPRNERPEWAAIGLLGKLVCLDDGTAKVNDYVKPNENAVATVSETQTKYRVMRRIDGSHIQIMIL